MDVRDESWFFQEMSPLLATELLKKMANNEGAFLVRSFKKRLALSYVWQQSVKHCWISVDPGGAGCYLLPQERFDSVQELVQHYGSTPCSNLGGLRLHRFPLAEDVENFLRLPPADIEIGSDGRSCSLVNPLTTLEHGRFGQEAVSAISRRYNSHEVTACLRNAASMLMLLDHANLIKLIGLHHSPGHPMSGYCLITEHINCGSLRQFVHKQGERLLRDWEILISFGGQVANAAAYLHRKGVAHNELVLDNCLLERSDRFTVKLSGFEFARFEDSSPRPLVHLMWRKYCRVAPACPEIATGAKQLPTCASDVWALGLLVWSLFSHGSHPSECPGAQPPPLALNSPLLPKELTAALDHLIRSCLHRMPQLRISSVEVGKQLRNLIDFRSYLNAKFADQSYSSGVSSADLEPFSIANGVELSSSSLTTTPPPQSADDGGAGGVGGVGGATPSRKPSRRLGLFRSKKWKSASLADTSEGVISGNAGGGSGGGSGGGFKRLLLFSRSSGGRKANRDASYYENADNGGVKDGGRGTAATSAVQKSKSAHQLAQPEQRHRRSSETLLTSSVTVAAAVPDEQLLQTERRCQRLLDQLGQLRARCDSERDRRVAAETELRSIRQAYELRLADADSVVKQWRQQLLSERCDMRDQLDSLRRENQRLRQTQTAGRSQDSGIACGDCPSRRLESD